MTVTRSPHWIKRNHQERMPPRMVAFDTESRSVYDGDIEVQEWRVGCAIRWRTDLKSGDRAEGRVFDSPDDFWAWVSAFCAPGTRTVVWAHNLGHDIRISRMFEVLPRLGFRLEWCNLDRNISSATWRSDHGTIVLADTWTWLPLPLNVIAPQVGLVKYEMPGKAHPDSEWARYCMRDAEILYNVCTVLMAYIKAASLGNWQPTGAGMAYATWRHRFMSDKVLVHDDRDALQAERIAMHTGRAEAWRHGEVTGERWTEVDLKNAYVTIAANHDLPRKIHMHHGTLSTAQFHKLSATFALLCRVRIDTSSPCVPYRVNGRHIWPVGQFDTWIWDNEVQMALESGAMVKIREAYSYVRGPVLQDWARWVLAILYQDTEDTHPVVRTWVKHCGRSLIGRLSLRAPSWERWGANIEGITGITHMVFPEEGVTRRALHVGQDVLIETGREESRDSLPMITGWIMSKCRALLWEGMNAAGLENLAHVDTDSVLCNTTGLNRLREYYGTAFSDIWAIKGTCTRLEMFGPRSYYRGKDRVTSGIPRKAEEVSPGVYTGERWSALASDLESGHHGHVRVSPGTWTLRRNDPRRRDATGGVGRTEAYDAAGLSSANGSSSVTM